MVDLSGDDLEALAAAHMHTPITTKLRRLLEYLSKRLRDGTSKLEPSAPGGPPGTCFIAMSFDASLNAAYDSGIACGHERLSHECRSSGSRSTQRRRHRPHISSYRRPYRVSTPVDTISHRPNTSLSSFPPCPSRAGRCAFITSLVSVQPGDQRMPDLFADVNPDVIEHSVHACN